GAYELEGHDYPYGFVRWPTNRNLQPYLELIAIGAVDFLGLIETEVNLEDATEAYHELVNAPAKPLAVVLRYGGDEDQWTTAGGAEESSLVAARTRIDLEGANPVRPA